MNIVLFLGLILHIRLSKIKKQTTFRSEGEKPRILGRFHHHSICFRLTPQSYCDYSNSGVAALHLD